MNADCMSDEDEQVDEDHYEDDGDSDSNHEEEEGAEAHSTSQKPRENPLIIAAQASSAEVAEYKQAAQFVLKLKVRFSSQPVTFRSG